MLNTSSKNRQQPLKIGITGGIGSGKSVVCRIFAILGIPVFGADLEARRIIDHDPEIREALSQLLGREIFPASGVTDRKKMAVAIFNNRELLHKVNSIVHPAVRRRFTEWWQIQESPYVIQEAAILFESGASGLMDLNILVTAPVEVRIDRVMQRDRISREQVQERMDNQWPDEKKSSLADFVILNDGNQLLIEQVMDIHHKILKHGKIW
jgi:dephospho-CoA kinase